MRFFDTEILNQWSEHWFSTILAAGSQALIVAAVIGVILLMLRNRVSSQLKYALLILVLLKFAAPPFLQLSTGIFSQPSISRLPFLALDQQTITVNLQPKDVHFEDTYRDDRETVTAAQATALQPSATTSVAQASPTQNTVNSSSSAVAPQANLSWKSLLMVGYFAGVLLFLIRLTVQYRRALRVVETATPVTSGPLLDRLVNLTKQLGLTTTPSLRVGQQSLSPFVIGLFKPTIVIPADILSQTDDDAVDIILAHELVHLRRGDLWLGWFETLINSLWWFHPAMWWLKAELRQAREDCCDDVLLVNEIADPQRYCETLIGFAGSRDDQALEPVVAGFFGGEHAIARRMRRLMDGTLTRSNMLSKSALFGAILLAAVALPGMQGQGSSPVTETTLENLWGGWRNLPFSITAEKEEAVNKCRQIANKYHHQNGRQRAFFEPETEQELLAIIKQHPDLFYAHQLLATWYLNHKQLDKAKTHMDTALSKAPVVLTQRYHTGDGKPAKGLVVSNVGIECNRVQKGRKDSSLELEYYGLVTDDKGEISLPVYDTVYRLSGISYPNDYRQEKERLGWFKSKTRIGILPPVLVWKEGSRPLDFTRSITDVPNMKKAVGTDGTKLTVGDNVFEIGSVSRCQADNSFTSEDGQGTPLAATAVDLPKLENGAYMDHAVIDFSSPLGTQFAINHLEIREGQTNLPLRGFQDATGFMQSGERRIHLFSLFETLPEKVTLVMSIQNYQTHVFKMDLPSELGAEVEHAGTSVRIVELNEGHHRHWDPSDGYQGEHEGVEQTCEVVFNISGGNRKLSPWIVLKDGRRWRLHSGWYQKNYPFRHQKFFFPLDQIDHFEMRPYQKPTKIYFEGVKLPKRTDAKLAAVPPIEAVIDRAPTRTTSNVLEPLQTRICCGMGESNGSSSSAQSVYFFTDENQADREDTSHVYFVTPKLSKLSGDLSYFDGMDENSTGNFNIGYMGGGVLFRTNMRVPIGNIQSVRLQLKPEKHK